MVEEGDRIRIDIPQRSIELLVDDEELAARRARMEALGNDAWQPHKRKRYVSAALQAYAALTTSAAQGAPRRGPAAALNAKDRLFPLGEAHYATPPPSFHLHCR